MEVPDDLLRFESRDPRSTFTAYVPIGSIAKGEALVVKGGSGKTIQCALCHGAYLTGLGPLPSIAGRSPSYMFRQLYDFQHGAPPKGGPVAREPETIISGTGFFVAANRVVTNNHVVSGCTKDIQVRYPNRRAYTATISGQDATNDLVVLYTDMDNLSIAGFYPRPRVGDQVASYGFPRSDILSSSGNCTVGNVTSLTGPKDDTRFLQMSAPIQPGNSGGALLDMSGSVVGVVVAQLSVLQNVNFAIQPSMVINFLEVKDVTPKLDTAKAPRSPTEVCEIATKFTIQVYCQDSPEDSHWNCWFFGLLTI